MTARVLWYNATLATLTHGAPDGWGLVPNGALLTEGSTIAWVGPYADRPALAAGAREVDLGGRVVTPGLIDCHTHLVYGGHRANEAEMRANGATYEEIARAGGGIRSTMAATRAASEQTLYDSAVRRARVAMCEGVTTMEIKSGYGLSYESEERCLGVARALGHALPLDVRTTFLGAHALPPEYEGRADEYIGAVCEWMPRLHAAGLIDAVDAFCETIGFTPAQTQRVFEQARALGLPVKLHAEQLSDQGGAVLAARLLLRARDKASPDRRPARRWRPPGPGHRLQSRHLAADLAAADHEHGRDPVPPDGRRVPGRRHPRGRPRPGPPRRGRHAGGGQGGRHHRGIGRSHP